MSNQEQTPGPGEGATSSTAGAGGQPSEEEMRAAMEAEFERLTVSDVLLQTLITLLNLGGRKLGTVPGSEARRDLAQVQAAIEGVRALLPVVERTGAAGAEDLGPARDVLSQLQMAYAKLSGESGAAPGAAPAADPTPADPAQDTPEEESEEPSIAQPLGSPPAGPAQSSGRLWVPGER